MKPVPILALLIAAPALTACGGWKPSGSVQVVPPDAALMAPCPKPGDYLGTGDWEIMAGRLGVALIRCGQEKQALADWSADVVETLAQ